ncbi:MAG: hypothetical protein ACRDOH_34550, partial [Streptosporangiaceae bacterium]
MTPGTDASRRTAVERDASPGSARDASLADRYDASRRSGATQRLCAWCSGPIPGRMRRDAVCCSVRCRQARHRFLRAVGHAGTAAPGRPLRLAYADPPYPGKAWLYRDHPDYAGEVDHAGLIRRLSSEYDGWALSTSAEALPAVLALCPPGVRVAAWHRGERATRSAWPLHAWEPVIYHGGRQLAAGPPGRDGVTARRVDSIVCGPVALTTLPGRVIGAKPAAVCRWIFDLLGAQPGDTLDDLFPGSGAVTRAWAAFTDPSRRPRGDASPVAMHDASFPSASDASFPAASDASHQARANASSPVEGTHRHRWKQDMRKGHLTRVRPRARGRTNPGHHLGRRGEGRAAVGSGGRRPRCTQPRDVIVRVKFTTAEKATLDQAAGRAALSLAAWLGQ